MTQDIDLVVGGRGKVGYALAAALRRRGASVLTTGRQPGDGIDIVLDFENPNYSVLPTGIKRAYICAAMPGTEACAAEPEKSYAVNVAVPVDLTQHLGAGGAFVVNLSTTQVFDGQSRSVAADAPHAPYSVYGRQKSEMEARLREGGRWPNALVRMTKVLSPTDLGILAKWHASLSDGAPVSAFSDRSMSPVVLRQVVDALVAVAYGPWEGIHQFSASDEISYFDAALRIAEIVGKPRDLVRPILAGADNGNAPPRHAGLDSRETEARLGWRFASSEQVVREVLDSET